MDDNDEQGTIQLTLILSLSWTMLLTIYTWDRTVKCSKGVFDNILT